MKFTLWPVTVACFALACFATFNAAAQFVPITDESSNRLVSTARGVVVDSEGRPVSDARVLAISGWEEPILRELMYTDENGVFEFPDLSDGWWQISVDHPDFAKEWERERGIRFPAGASQFPLTITLRPPTPYSATVVNGRGKPVAGVTVILNLERPEGAEKVIQGHSTYDLQVTTTGDNGEFSLQRLRRGEIGLVLEHPEYAQTRAYPLSTDATNTRILIDDGIELAGVVEDDAGPVSGAVVAVHAMSAGARPYGEWKLTTDSEGWFRVARVPDLSRFAKHNFAVFTVRLDDARWRSNDYELYQMESGVIPEPRIAAVLKDERKFTPQKIAVGKREGDHADASMIRVVQPAAADATAGDDEVYSVYLRSVDKREKTFRSGKDTDENGAVLFDAVPPGEYVAYAWNRSRFHYPAKRVVVAPYSDQTVVLDAGSATLTGRIEGIDDPFGKHYLSWFAREPWNGIRAQGGGHIDENGRFEISGLAPGNYRLVYEGERLMMNTFYVSVVDGANRLALDLPMSRIEGRLVGVPYPVVDEDDTGHIRINPSGTTVSSGNLVARVHADADGGFFVDHVPPGRYVVNMKSPTTGEILRSVVDIPNDATVVQVELRPSERTGQIQGRMSGLDRIVFHSEYGSDMSLGLARLDPQGYEFAAGYWSSVDDSTGAYTFRNIPEGTYGLMTHGDDGAPALWFPNIEVRADMTLVFDIEIPEHRQVEIHLDIAGFNVSKRIWYLYIDGVRIKYDQFIGSSPSGMRAGHGPFGLAYGVYVVEADFGDGYLAQKTIEVVPGEGAQVIGLTHPLAPDAEDTALESGLARAAND